MPDVGLDGDSDGLVGEADVSVAAPVVVVVRGGTVKPAVTTAMVVSPSAANASLDS